MSVKGSSSKWKPIESGVPQGSVLSLILFIMYVNDIPNIVKRNDWIFADHTKLSATTDQTKNFTRRFKQSHVMGRIMGTDF